MVPAIGYILCASRSRALDFPQHSRRSALEKAKIAGASAPRNGILPFRAPWVYAAFLIHD